MMYSGDEDYGDDITSGVVDGHNTDQPQQLDKAVDVYANTLLDMQRKIDALVAALKRCREAADAALKRAEAKP